MFKKSLPLTLISLALAAGILVAALPATPALAQSVPADTAAATWFSAAAPALAQAAGSCRSYIQDRHVTIEHRGDVTIVHVTETIVTMCDGRRIERHVSFTYVRR